MTSRFASTRRLSSATSPTPTAPRTTPAASSLPSSRLSSRVSKKKQREKTFLTSFSRTPRHCVCSGHPRLHQGAQGQALYAEGRSERMFCLFFYFFFFSEICDWAGCKYKIEVSFRVQHEIVSGLCFVNSVYKGPIKVTTDKASQIFCKFFYFFMAHFFFSCRRCWAAMVPSRSPTCAPLPVAVGRRRPLVPFIAATSRHDLNFEFFFFFFLLIFFSLCCVGQVCLFG